MRHLSYLFIFSLLVMGFSLNLVRAQDDSEYESSGGDSSYAAGNSEVQEPLYPPTSEQDEELPLPTPDEPSTIPSDEE